MGICPLRRRMGEASHDVSTLASMFKDASKRRGERDF